MARIVVGVGGSIAAYKACDLVSKLVQADHVVDVILSRAAERFVRPLAFAALTHRAVFTNKRLWQDTDGAAGPAAHLRVTDEADVFVIAPCTANLIGAFAHGLAQEILGSTYLGAACPVFIAPAMHTRMWNHPRVQANVARLREDGVGIIGPATGYLAEGQEGTGRMEEPAGILETLTRFLST